jgi:hypothetical protein
MKDLVMKKIILLGLACYGNFLLGMDLETVEIDWGKELLTTLASIEHDLKSERLPIKLTFQPNFYKHPEKASPLTIVGLRQQNVLKGINSSGICIADIEKVDPAKVYVRSDVFEKRLTPGCSYRFPSITVDDETFAVPDQSSHARIIAWPKTLVVVGEPELSWWKGKPQYRPLKRIDEYSVIDPFFEGVEALKELQKDLMLCYTTVLEKGASYFTSKDEKILAFSLLSKVFDVPEEVLAWAAVKSIVDYLADPVHKNMYKRIELVVEHEEDYLECLKYLQPKMLKKKNINEEYYSKCLASYTQKHPEITSQDIKK